VNLATLEVFAVQHGVATDQQLRRAGVTWAQQDAALRRGEWARVAPNVIRLAGTATSWHQRAMRAVLEGGRGALLGAVSAARLHRLDGFETTQAIEIILPVGGHAPQGVTVRWSRRVSGADRHVIDGIPVTILPVTLIHLAATHRNVEQALDAALRQGFSPRWLTEVFERWAGTPGTAAVRRLLADRAGRPLPRSWFQRLAKRLLEADGIALVDEWPVHDEHGRLLAELDLAHVELKVGVECQSVRWHGTAADRARDAARARKFRQLGWEIVEVWWADLERMDAVLADLRLALDKALAVSRR